MRDDLSSLPDRGQGQSMDTDRQNPAEADPDTASTGELATGQTMHVQRSNMAAAKDLSAAQRAAEEAVAGEGEGDGATVNPESFRSISPPPSAEATRDDAAAPAQP